jgi:hypothetical protein
MSKTLERKHWNDQPISRRRFFRSAAAGVGGAAVTLSGIEAPSAQSRSVGRITLDALLISYFSASVGSTGRPLWTFSGAYANTLRFKVEEFPDLALKPKPDPTDKIVFAGHAIEQIKSEQLKNGLVMRHKGFSHTSYAFGNENVVHTSEDTTFFSILRPRLEIIGNQNKASFRFVEDDNGTGGSLFPQTVSNLQGQPELRLLSRETADSWLRVYVTDPEELVKPRFKLKATTGSISAGASTDFDLTGDGDKEFSASETAVTSAKIIAQSGFSSDALRQAFAVGNHLQITHSSLQEVEGEEVVRMRTTISRAVRGTNDIYWDSVFKTFVIVDSGS